MSGLHEVRITLDFRSAQTRRNVSKPHLIHKTLEAINPSRTRVLWRLLSDRLLVRSASPLDWIQLDQRHPDFGQRTHRLFPSTRRSGEVYLINLFVYARTRPRVGPWQPKAPDDYIDWFHLQGDRYGFRVLESSIVRQQPYRVETSSMLLTIMPVELVGFVEISSAEKFRLVFEEGIGRMRAFGCGLLLVKSLS